MSDLISMGGYEFYVWSSFGLFVAALIWDWLSPRQRERAALRRVEQLQKRHAARTAP